MECHDRANVLAGMGDYVWADQNIPGPLAACLFGYPFRLARCQSKKKTHHRPAAVIGAPAPAAGAIIHPFETCLVCSTQATQLLSNARRRADAPGLAFPLRGNTTNGHNGTHTRGHLCQRCIDAEIEAFWNRVHVQRQTQARAASTCKCKKDLVRRLCYRDKRDLREGMQRKSDANAGPAGWLEQLSYDPLIRRARLARTAAARAALLNRRRTAVPALRDNACRCGRDVLLTGPVAPVEVPRPVALCTACNGVEVTYRGPGSLPVRDWAGLAPIGGAQGTDEKNLDLGRRVL